MSYYLITGASSGIGKAFATLLAEKKKDLILVARSVEKLESLRSLLVEKYSVNVLIKSCDLSIPQNAKNLVKELNQEDISVECLVNNAGIGRMEQFADDDIEGNEQMMNLNMNSLVVLTHAVLPGMVNTGHGKILNIASTAAFQPGPNMSVYYASKAFVLNFSEAIHEELKDKNISVSCLCPGPVDTSFFDGHGLGDIQNLNKVPWVKTAEEVARQGIEMMERNQAVGIAGWMNFIIAQTVRISPRFLVRKITRLINN